MMKMFLISIIALVLAGCSDPWSHVAERGEIMNHPFYGEVQFSWHWKKNQCVVDLKSGKRATVLCKDLSHERKTL